MGYFRLCPVCGDRLDPGEKCDCRDKKRQEEEFWERKLKAGADGQYVLRFGKEQRNGGNAHLGKQGRMA